MVRVGLVTVTVAKQHHNSFRTLFLGITQSEVSLLQTAHSWANTEFSWVSGRGLGLNRNN